MLQPTYRLIERIVSNTTVSRVLEVGATLGAFSLLNIPSLASAEKTGLNLTPGESRHYPILEGNVNDMHIFADASFDCVLCNAVLEHDLRFWEALSEADCSSLIAMMS